jgi:hypothetical protein
MGQRLTAMNIRYSRGIVTYVVQTRWGSSERTPGVKRMREILKELDKRDPEHPDTWLTHESGWSLSLAETGLAVWENAESADTEPRHMTNVDRDQALWMWIQLSRGDIAAIERLTWQPGGSPPLDMDDRARSAERARQERLAQQRHFYDALGPEEASSPCAHPGCSRGAIELSLLCRVHHFENVMRCRCPFSD